MSLVIKNPLWFAPGGTVWGVQKNFWINKKIWSKNTVLVQKLSPFSMIFFKISSKIHRFREKNAKIGFFKFFSQKLKIYVFISPGLYLHALETNFWWFYKFLKIDQNHNFFSRIFGFFVKKSWFFLFQTISRTHIFLSWFFNISMRNIKTKSGKFFGGDQENPPILGKLFRDFRKVFRPPPPKRNYPPPKINK